MLDHKKNQYNFNQYTPEESNKKENDEFSSSSKEQNNAYTISNNINITTEKKKELSSIKENLNFTDENTEENNDKNNSNYSDNFISITKLNIDSENNKKNEKLITLNDIITSKNNDLLLNFDANKSKNSEEIEQQKEEEFLMMEDMKLQKYKNQNNNNNQSSEEGKENVVDDEEDNEYINNNDNMKININNIKNKNSRNIGTIFENNSPKTEGNISKYNNESKIKKNEINLFNNYMNQEEKKFNNKDKYDSNNNEDNNNLKKIVDNKKNKENIYEKKKMNNKIQINSRNRDKIINSPNKDINFKNSTIYKTERKNENRSPFNDMSSEKNNNTNKKGIGSRKNTDRNKFNNIKNKIFISKKINISKNRTAQKLNENNDNYITGENGMNQLNRNINLNANKKKNINIKPNVSSDKIYEVINKYIKDEKLSIINIIQCFCELDIIKELINVNEVKDLNLNNIKKIIDNIQQHEQKKLNELEFIEQFWFIINPALEEYINYQFFSILINQLFLIDDSNQKEFYPKIEAYIRKNLIGIKLSNDKETMISPLRNTIFLKREIWPIPTLIKTFLKLKSDIKPDKIKKLNRNRIAKTPIKDNYYKLEQKKLDFTPVKNKQNIERPKTPDIKIKKKKKKKRNNSKPVYERLIEIGENYKRNVEIKREENNDIILFNANSKKFNDNSEEMITNMKCKKLDNIIKKYQNNGKFYIENIIQCFYCLGIIAKLIDSEQLEDLNLKKLKVIIDNIQRNEQKKVDELKFIEQFWFIINPSLDENINYQTFSELMLLILIQNSNNKNYFSNIETYIKKNQIGIKVYNNKERFFSPLTDKIYEKNEIWSIRDLIKMILKLKNDNKGYRNNEYEIRKIKLKNKIIEEKNKDLTFIPELLKSKRDLKNSKNKGNSKDNISNDSRINNFEKVYSRFMEKQKAKEQALEILRQKQIQKELHKCQSKPKIIKYKLRNKYIENRMNKSVDITSLNRNQNNKITIPIYERLYGFRKIYNVKKIVLPRDSSANRFNSKNSLRDKNNSKDNSQNNIKNYKNIYSKQMNKKEENHNNNNNLNNQNNLVNKNLNIKNVYSKNIQAKRIKPLSISKEKKNNIDIYNDNNNIYVIQNIKTPNGELKPIKIFKNENNINNLVDDFCKKNNINEKDKNDIYNQVIFIKNNIYGRNTYNTNLKESKLNKILNQDFINLYENRRNKIYTYNNNNNENGGLEEKN